MSTQDQTTQDTTQEETQDNNIMNLFEGMTREQADELLKRYESQVGTEEDLKRFISREKYHATQTKNKVNQTTLMEEYKERLAKCPPAQVAMLKDQFRKRGLNIY